MMLDSIICPVSAIISKTEELLDETGYWQMCCWSFNVSSLQNDDLRLTDITEQTAVFLASLVQFHIAE